MMGENPSKTSTSFDRFLNQWLRSFERILKESKSSHKQGKIPQQLSQSFKESQKSKKDPQKQPKNDDGGKSLENFNQFW